MQNAKFIFDFRNSIFNIRNSFHQFLKRPVERRINGVQYRVKTGVIEQVPADVGFQHGSDVLVRPGKIFPLPLHTFLFSIGDKISKDGLRYGKSPVKLVCIPEKQHLKAVPVGIVKGVLIYQPFVNA